MPDFGDPFAGLAANRKVTHEELVRAIRFSIAAEYEAVQLYTQLAESTDNMLAQEVLKDIADEELVHVGEFLRVLKELAPNEAALYAEGEAEVEEIAASLNQREEAGESEIQTADEKAEDTSGKDSQVEEPKKETQQQSPGGIGNLFEQS